jgi:hypothetical protein
MPPMVSASAAFNAQGMLSSRTRGLSVSKEWPTIRTRLPWIFDRFRSR